MDGNNTDVLAQQLEQAAEYLREDGCVSVRAYAELLKVVSEYEDVAEEGYL